jgi:hypothetical protein
MGGCETRFKEAAVETATQYLLGLLDPATVANALLGGESGGVEP